MKTKYLIISMLFIISAALSGCGGDGTCDIEEYMQKNPAAKQQVQQTVSGMSDEDIETEISFDRNTVIVTARVSTTYSDKMVKKMKKEFSDLPNDTFSGSIRQLEESSGISGIHVKLILLNGDGAEIMAKVFGYTSSSTQG